MIDEACEDELPPLATVWITGQNMTLEEKSWEHFMYDFNRSKSIKYLPHLRIDSDSTLFLDVFIAPVFVYYEYIQELHTRSDKIEQILVPVVKEGHRVYDDFNASISASGKEAIPKEPDTTKCLEKVNNLKINMADYNVGTNQAYVKDVDQKPGIKSVERPVQPRASSCESSGQIGKSSYASSLVLMIAMLLTCDTITASYASEENKTHSSLIESNMCLYGDDILLNETSLPEKVVYKRMQMSDGHDSRIKLNSNGQSLHDLPGILQYLSSHALVLDKVPQAASLIAGLETKITKLTSTLDLVYDYLDVQLFYLLVFSVCVLAIVVPMILFIKRNGRIVNYANINNNADIHERYGVQETAYAEDLNIHQLPYPNLPTLRSVCRTQAVLEQWIKLIRQSIYEDFREKILRLEQDLANKSEEAEELKRSKTCYICMENDRCVLQPCGHSVVCNACARQIMQCPVCRHRVENVINVYNC